MIDHAVVHFSDGFSREVERANIKDSGWLMTREGDEWTYHPPYQIEKVVSIREADE